MLFAINEINEKQDLLPNTDLGYVIYDSCFTISKAVEGTLTYLTGQDEAVPNYRCGSGAPLAALVGAGGSDLSIATARILGLYHFPQVGQWGLEEDEEDEQIERTSAMFASSPLSSLGQLFFHLLRPGK